MLQVQLKLANNMLEPFHTHRTQYLAFWCSFPRNVSIQSKHLPFGFQLECGRKSTFLDFKLQWLYNLNCLLNLMEVFSLVAKCLLLSVIWKNRNFPSLHTLYIAPDPLFEIPFESKWNIQSRMCCSLTAQIPCWVYLKYWAKTWFT